MMVTFFPFLGEGPIYALVSQSIFIDNCKHYWWTNLLLINNFYPWKLSKQCGLALTFFANEFWLCIVFVPLYIFLYKNTFRKVFVASFVVIAVFLSIIPTIVLSIQENVNSYPNMDTMMSETVLSRIYYRLPAFLCGLSLAIIKFEYKYVDKLNDGSYPFHKKLIEKIKTKKHFKIITYLVGLVFVAFPILIQYTNTACVDQTPLKDT